MTDLENKMHEAVYAAIDKRHSDIEDEYYDEAASDCAIIAQQHAEELACELANWIEVNKYYKRYSTHPKYVEKWFSDYRDTGYLTTKELYQQFLKETGK